MREGVEFADHFAVDPLKPVGMPIESGFAIHSRETCLLVSGQFDSIRFEVVYSDHRNIPNCRFSGVVERSSGGEN